MRAIDNFLNNITMYRLVLYFLILLAAVGLFYSLFGVLPYDPITYVFSFTLILTVSFVTNWIFAKTFNAPTNVESVWISALILGLIIAPAKNLNEIIFLGWASILTMTFKYVIAVNKKHIFNPVAISVAITAIAINVSANWWVGSASMLPIVAIGGLLVVRKIRRWDLVLSFLGAAMSTIFFSKLLTGSDPVNAVWRSIADTPLVFFAVIMLTEPLTTPPTRILRIVYGTLVGLLFAPQIHLGSIYTTPELALVIGNIFSYVASPKYKLILRLKEKIRLSPDTYEFVFATNSPIDFIPGQYMEFTFEHSGADSRGNRRYLSLASSPTEPEIRLGIKFANPPSSFKRNLFLMTADQKIVASQLIGDFTLPKDQNKKLVFIAGGIGITPFRSMLKYLIDTGERRDIVVLYSAKVKEEFVYLDVLKSAQDKLGIRTIFNESSTQGHLDPNRFAEAIPDYQTRIFYISGSHAVVTAFENVLKQLGIPRRQIVTDYFPGFA
jgi:ferredoxin-NADP reductase